MLATNPSYDLTSSRCSAASAMTKMSASSWRKDRVAILYEVEVGNRIIQGRCVTCCAGVIGLFPSPVISVCSVIQSFACLLRFLKVSALIHWSLNTFIMQRNVPEIFRSDFFLAVYPRRNDLPMRFQRIE